MTQRQTITLNWRRTGLAPQRISDYAEVPNDPPAPAELQAEEPERREIGSRLENWARWCTANTRTIGVSPTGAFCDRLRREAMGDENHSGERRSIDEQDALRLERGMRDLDTTHRMLLWWCYIQQAMPEVVCRKMSIAHKPATVFINQFRQAQRAIESIVEKEHGEAMNLDDDDTVDDLPARPRQVIPAADRELLELAGRALGAVRVEDVEGELWVNLHLADGTVAHGWNPLLFYGDTFELAIALQITPTAGDVKCSAQWWVRPGLTELDSVVELTAGDARAATARAITRAAAEIGKQRS